MTARSVRAALTAVAALAAATVLTLLAAAGTTGGDGTGHEEAGRWSCAGIQPVAGICVDDPAPALPALPTL